MRSYALDRAIKIIVFVVIILVLLLCIISEYARWKPSLTNTANTNPKFDPTEILPTRIPTNTPGQPISIIVSPPASQSNDQTSQCSQPGESWVSPIDNMRLRCVPGGAFLMGSVDDDPYAKQDEKPQRQVILDPFFIDETEVTNAMFAAFVAETNYLTYAEIQGGGYAWSDIEVQYTLGANWRHPHGPKSNIDKLSDHPVVQISWEDANAYCKWAKRRLPTEAEWEKAARGLDARVFPWGDLPAAGNLLNMADKKLPADWSDPTINDGYQFTSPVGHYIAGASPYAALDMAGNVWEWTHDWYSDEEHDDSPITNPFGPPFGKSRTLRGGSWYNISLYVRTSMRGKLPSDYRSDSLGFRCALTP